MHSRLSLLSPILGRAPRANRDGSRFRTTAFCTVVTLEDDFVLSPRFVTRNVGEDGETSSSQRIFAGSAPPSKLPLREQATARGQQQLMLPNNEM